MHHRVGNERQSIEGKKLCSLAQCSSFCFKVCFKVENPFLKFSFVLGNKTAYLFWRLLFWMHCKAGRCKQRPKDINFKFEISVYTIRGVKMSAHWYFPRYFRSSTIRNKFHLFTSQYKCLLSSKMWTAAQNPDVYSVISN